MAPSIVGLGAQGQLAILTCPHTEPNPFYQACRQAVHWKNAFVSKCLVQARWSHPYLPHTYKGEKGLIPQIRFDLQHKTSVFGLVQSNLRHPFLSTIQQKNYNNNNNTLFDQSNEFWALNIA